jgi:hypothetical protein
MDVLCSIHLGVQVNDSSSTSKSAVGSDLGSADPVVGATGSWGLRQLCEVSIDQT